jgi:glutathione S-transferase
MIQVSEFLGDNKFFMGDNVTIADFIFLDVINWHLKLEDETDNKTVNKYANILAFKDYFEALPKIKSFLSGDKAHTGIFGAGGQWATK